MPDTGRYQRDISQSKETLISCSLIQGLGKSLTESAIHMIWMTTSRNFIRQTGRE